MNFKPTFKQGLQVKQGLQANQPQKTKQPQKKMKKENQPLEIIQPVMIRYNLTIQHKQDENFFEVASFSTLNKARNARNVFAKSFDSKIEVQVFTNQGWKNKTNLASLVEKAFA